MKVIEVSRETAVDPAFAEEILRRSGENVFLCYQCRKCASGCPVREFMDGSPALIMRYAQLGMKDRCMKGSAVWYCSSCQTCTTRCPAGIDIAHVIDTIRIAAQESGAKIDTKGMKTFNFLWMTMLRFMGRAYEIGVVGGLNTLMGKPLKDLPLGIKMIAKGKMSLFPSIKRPFEMMRIFSRAGRMKR